MTETFLAMVKYNIHERNRLFFSHDIHEKDSNILNFKPFFRSGNCFVRQLSKRIPYVISGSPSNKQEFSPLKAKIPHTLVTKNKI